MTIKPAITMAAGLLGAISAASADDMRCEVSSDYELTLNPRSLILIRESGTPQRLVMRQGALFVDDRWVELSADDRTRLIQFERQTRDVVPLAQAVGREAADIAVTAVGEVAAGFSRSPEATRAQLRKVREKIDVRLKQGLSKSQLTLVDIDDDIGALVAELLPQLIGDVVAGAVQSAMTGNDVQLRSLDGVEARIERLVEPQARALRPRAQQLCERLEALDGLDNALAYRLPSGEPLQLLRVDPRAAK
ncbi:YggN family protein [Xanthomonas prunicola]|uniref:YggN family protein n=1 Tax=Xanthomonas prunicola TaxID=2053930 RepID=A0A9Q9IWJ3_9XANT|nr:YggN family protein [Xanthomonas prunicola]UXA61998.1 YggN family protein [Xanthomonas prunicola]UXA64191.1 YggN family protein [Xanthomonas prunicola]